MDVHRACAIDHEGGREIQPWGVATVFTRCDIGHEGRREIQPWGVAMVFTNTARIIHVRPEPLGHTALASALLCVAAGGPRQYRGHRPAIIPVSRPSFRRFPDRQRGGCILSVAERGTFGVSVDVRLDKVGAAPELLLWP